MLVEWNEDKNQWLIENRGVSFEEAEEIYSAGQYIQVIDHPYSKKYQNQKTILFSKNNYIYCAPFIETEKEMSMDKGFHHKLFCNRETLDDKAEGYYDSDTFQFNFFCQ